MLQALFYYLVTWWFVKLESKKLLTVRAVLAGVFAACCFAITIGMIVLLANTAETFALVLLIFYLILFSLFFIRSLCDIAKIRALSVTEWKEPETPTQNTNTNTKSWL